MHDLIICFRQSYLTVGFRYRSSATMVNNTHCIAGSRFVPWLEAARSRIDAQRAIVETLLPGSRAHRMASEVLLTLQDSLHVLHEAQATIELVQRSQGSRRQL